MGEAPLPRRFVVVGLEEAVPDGAEHIDSVFLQVEPESLLALHLFEIPPKLGLDLFTEKEHARA